LQCVAVYHSVLQRVAASCSVLQHVVERCSVLKYRALLTKDGAILTEYRDTLRITRLF